MNQIYYQNINCGIEDDGGRAIAEAMKAKMTLKRIDLSGIIS